MNQCIVGLVFGWCEDFRWNVIIPRAGWIAPSQLWTLRRGDRRPLEDPSLEDSKFKVWTEFTVPASQDEANCRVVEEGGVVSVCLVSDVGPGDLIVPDRDSQLLLSGLCLTDLPLDLSSPLYLKLQHQTGQKDQDKLNRRYELTSAENYFWMWNVNGNFILD